MPQRVITPPPETTVVTNNFPELTPQEKERRLKQSRFAFEFYAKEQRWLEQDIDKLVKGVDRNPLYLKFLKATSKHKNTVTMLNLKEEIAAKKLKNA